MSNLEQNTWHAVDQYIEAHLIADNPVLAQTLARTTARGLPEHLHIAPNQGALLAMLIQLQQCKRILELGTFAAYSTICMAQALPPEGYILTIEGREAHLNMALENIQAAGYAQMIDARLGRAADVLRDLAADTEPFDLVFIDADKQSYAEYLDLCLAYCHSGSLIVLDNVVRAGEIINPDNQKPSIQGLRDLFRLMQQHPKLNCSTALQTVGAKGHDGFAIAVVK
jgi:predicted O-methyltransferase YrrM